VSEADLKAAKKAMLVEIGEASVSASGLVGDVGISALLRSGHPLSDVEKHDLVVQATLADVQVKKSRLS
jgi:hypothetical protein